MTQVSITSVIREAILNNNVRSYAFDEIAKKLNVSRFTAPLLIPLVPYGGNTS